MGSHPGDGHSGWKKTASVKALRQAWVNLSKSVTAATSRDHEFQRPSLQAVVMRKPVTRVAANAADTISELVR